MGQPVHGKQKSHGKLRHRFRGIAGNTQKHNFILRRFHIHVIVAGAPKQNSLDLHFIERVYHFGIYIIIDENADCIIPLRHEYGFLIAGRLDKMNVKAIFLSHRFKTDFIIRFRPVKCNFHIIPPYFSDMLSIFAELSLFYSFTFMKISY